MLDGKKLLTGVTLFLLVLFFRGNGHHGILVLVWLALSAIILYGFPGYRNNLRRSVRHYWNEITSYDPASSRLPWRATFWLIVVPCLVLYLINCRYAPSLDNLPVNLVATNLILRGTTEVSQSVPELKGGTCTGMRISYSLRCTPKGVYSDYPIGMVPFALPTFALSRVLGGEIETWDTQWRLAKWTGAWLAAWSVGLVLLILLQMVKPAAALWTAGIIAVGSVMVSTISHGLWGHTGIVFLILVVLLIEFYLPFRGQKWALLLQGVALGWMFACRLTSATFILPFLLWVFFRNPRRGMATGLVAAIAHCPFLIYYHLTYGNIWGPQMLMGQRQPWGPIAQGLNGILISPGRGLLVYQPWILLIVLGIAAKRKSVELGWKTFCWTAIGLQVALVARWGCWWGGWCWGSRLLSETIPLFGLLVAPAMEKVTEKRHGPVVLAGVTAASFFMHLGGAYLPGMKWMAQTGTTDQQITEWMWSWSHPPFLYFLSWLGLV